MALARRSAVIAGLASAGLIGLEVAWTRIFSAELYHSFAFLVLSLAVLGLGLGGLLLRLVPALREPARLGLLLVLAAAAGLAGPPLVLHLGVDVPHALASVGMTLRLVLMLLGLAAAFGAGGAALALVFRTGFTGMPALYMADLLGAAAGGAVTVLLMNVVGTPAATVLCAAPLALAAALAGGRRVRVAAALVVLAGGVALPWAGQLLSKPRQERAPVLSRHWDAMALVKVLDFGDARGVNIDNAANTPISPFDGDFAKLRAEPSGFLVDTQPLTDAMSGPHSFLSIGPGGGGDVLMALKNGAAEVHAVEVNGYVNSLLLPGGAYAEYSGRLYSDPRVRVVTSDARSYLRRFDGRFDLIYSFSSNTFAALASGAFALAENYLFTTEALADAYRALSPRGFLVVEHQFYVPRLVSEAVDALRSRGVAAPATHLAVFASPRSKRQVLLVAKAPLTPDLLAAPFLALREHDFELMHRVFPDPMAGASPLVARIVAQGWRSAGADSPTDLSPTTDDRPFIAQQGLFKNFRLAAMRSFEAFEFKGFPLARATVLTILAVVLLLVLPLNLLPLARRREPALGLAGGLYFFAIGVGYMALEVVLIQKMTLLLGSGAYTVATILVALLGSSGVGARFAPRFGERAPFVAIVALVALAALLLGPVIGAAAAWSLPARVALTATLVAPLGFFMGMPFPLGTARVGDLVDWGFAVNGMASVAGSAGVLLVSFEWGLTAGLALGGIAYVAAGTLLARRTGWVRSAREAPEIADLAA